MRRRNCRDRNSRIRYFALHNRLYLKK
jgi:hypothetical protein